MSYAGVSACAGIDRFCSKLTTNSNKNEHIDADHEDNYHTHNQRLNDIKNQRNADEFDYASVHDSLFHPEWMLVGWESLLNGLHVKHDIVIMKTAVSSDEEES